MSLERRRGLFGELYFLVNEVVEWTSPSAGLHSWKGLMKANHDFQFPNGSIEVKTTSASTPHSFRISNVLQLDDESVPNLFIYLVTVDEHESGMQSLPEIIDAVRSTVDPHARIDFDDALVDAGYLPTHSIHYQSPRYSVRSIRTFRVTEGFPRILEKNLDQGVEGVTYAVAISACLEHECSPEEIRICTGADR
jgi:hypothetical protein